MADFEALPTEMAKQVASYLSFKDLKSLRATSKTMVRNTSDLLRNYCYHKTIKLNREELQKLVEATEPNNIGCILKSLQLNGLSFDLALFESNLPYTPESDCDNASWLSERNPLYEFKLKKSEVEQLHAENGVVELLVQAFTNIKNNIPEGQFKGINLGVQLCGDGISSVKAGDEFSCEASWTSSTGYATSWKSTWGVAAETFRATLTALCETGLAIESFTAFDQRHCALSTDRLLDVMNSIKGSLRFMRNLKSLNLGLSLPTKPISSNRTLRFPRPRYHPTSQEKRFIREQAHGLLALLKATPDLESLNLHWTNLTAVFPTNKHFQTEESEILDYAIRSVRLSRLHDLSLAGFTTRPDGLLRILERKPIKSLVLSMIKLSRGDFEEIFDHCIGPKTTLESFDFQYLIQHFWDVVSPKHFSAEGEALKNHAPWDGDYLEQDWRVNCKAWGCSVVDYYPCFDPKSQKEF